MFEIDVAAIRGRRCTLAGRVAGLDRLESATVEIGYADRTVHAFEVHARRPATHRFRFTAALDLTSAPLHALTCTLRLAHGVIRDLGSPLVHRIDIRDPRSLAQAGVPMPPEAEIARHFESLGDNCEFGVAMSHYGINRPSLFRFGGTTEFSEPERLPPTLLTEAILNYFEGLAEGSDLSFFMSGPEWIATSARYRFMGHTGMTDTSLTADDLRQLHNRRVRLGVRNFVELAGNPRTVFVRKSNGHETESDLRRHLDALRCMGEARLLWVAPCSPEAPAGMVSLLGNGLMQARIRGFAVYSDAGNPDLEAWRQVVANSWLAMQRVMHLQSM